MPHNHVMMALENIDHTILHLIHVWWSFSFLDPFFLFITDLHKQVWFFPVLLPLLSFLFWRKYGVRGLVLVPLLAINIGLCDFSGNRLTKRIIERPRPIETKNLGFLVFPKSVAHGSSFISNHSANMFCLATFCVSFLGHFWIFYLVAFLVAYSRVYNGVHFPSDVLAGAIYGFLVAQLMIFLLKKTRMIQWLKTKPDTSSK